MKFNPDIHHRHSIRIKEYDYSKEGLYFVTICTQNREKILSKIITNNVGAGPVSTLLKKGGIMKNKKYWIWLSRIEGLGIIKIKKLLEKYKTPETIWKLTKEELIQIKGIGEVIADQILDKRYRENLERYIEYMEKYYIGIITILDEDYPKSLKNIYDTPVVLYYKGDKQLLNNNKLVAIVGCRDCSRYGEYVSTKFAYDLSKEGICIISGMAKGIDSKAHLGALKQKGKTIAVLGSGLDRIYPSENIKLYNEIVKNGGLILSEYVIGTKANKLNFPARNRIISGLSNGVIVVEAKEKSGTLITVDFALEQGKDIFVVPGNINSENSFGTNELIKQGAKCVTCVEDILEEI